MRRLAIGLLAWDYPPSASGLAVAAREIAESLVEAGQDVRVFTLDRRGNQMVEGVEVIGCQPLPNALPSKLRRFGAVGHLVAPGCFAAAVKKAHRGRPFDVIEATNWYAPAALVRLATGVPVVTRNSTPAALTAGSGESRPSARDRLDARFAALLEMVSARASAGWISNTGAHADTIAGLYKLRPHQRVRPGASRHAVIGLSLPPARLLRGRTASYPPDEAGEIRLLFVGRAERRKGFDLLMGALEILAERAERGELREFALRIVGVASRDVPALSPGARSRMSLVGRLSEEELEREYEEAHAVVAPSRYESFGLVYQEALAFGRPVAALAEDASAREFIGDERAGLLAAPSTATALAEVVAQLIASSERRRSMRTEALRAAGRFDRASLARETLALYRAVLDR